MSAMLLQFAGSLVAVALLVLVVWLLRLGGEAHIAGEAGARDLADNAVCGFEAVAIALDRTGRGALLRDRTGRIVLLAPHGNRFAGRLLDGRAGVQLEGGRLTVTTGERRFRPVTLDVADAAAWCNAIEGLD